MIRNTLAVLGSALAAFMIVELITRCIVGYPTYGVSNRVYGARSPGLSTQVYEPHSRYWTVEGGNKVFRRNNLGLSGTDVHVSETSKYIFVLGDSFVDGREVPEDSKATSVFARQLQLTFPQFQVINLGFAGHDSYDLYFRSVYFEALFTPSLVYLVVQDKSHELLVRRKLPLRFDVRSTRSIDNSIFIRTHNFLRNSSAFLNLIGKAVYDNQKLVNQNTDADAVTENRLKYSETSARDPMLRQALFDCVVAFKRRYDGNMIIVSLAANDRLHAGLDSCCHAVQVAFFSKDILRREARLDEGKGHLNVDGHRQLGMLLYESFLAWAHWTNGSSR
jgi:hypothetical protein